MFESDSLKMLVINKYAAFCCVLHYILFLMRTFNFGAEAERSYFFRDLSLKTFLPCS